MAQKSNLYCRKNVNLYLFLCRFTSELCDTTNALGLSV